MMKRDIMVARQFLDMYKIMSIKDNSIYMLYDDINKIVKEFEALTDIKKNSILCKGEVYFNESMYNQLEIDYKKLLAAINLHCHTDLKFMKYITYCDAQNDFSNQSKDSYSVEEDNLDCITKL
ncbi:MAG: hypothetical protein ACYCPT_08335 [Acidimicrobiales bacterium]